MEDILALLPPEWAATWAEWAPLVLAVLTATSALVYAALPMARRLEAWAKSTPARWDDSAASWLVAALDYAASGLSWFLAHLPHVAPAAAPKEKETPDA